MSTTIIWHNPRCSKSREAISILEENKCENEVVKYLENPPNKEELKELLRMLGIQAKELMRTKEEIYKELNLKSVTDEDELINAMVQYPKLIERPVLIKDEKAIIGRPTSKILEFIGL